ncbi:gluzincin family metallopeptidase [Aequorivita vladivostokensis]|uniref:Metalloprotease n=1 Tax=Aequorivita vladivostokensis TaxID=171194 RepID=A0ABR5DJE8_9FLAO|nr:metalloprotease [Aequorivita vladivostokensis]KJJ38879.1 metalloprotease [Aequorivita vladivostokensis]
MPKRILYLLFFCLAAQAGAQHVINIDATLLPGKKTLAIKQQITYKNTSADTLRELYLFDWANSFSTKTSPLGKRFAENYDSSFHFEKEEERGKTTIEKIYGTAKNPLQWQRGDEVDILRIIPQTPLLPGDSYTFNLEYSVKVADSKFTRYGVDKNGNYKLRYWYISPAVYNGQWQVYSNKNIDDLYLTPSEFSVSLHFPKNYSLISDLDLLDESSSHNIKSIALAGRERTSATIYLEKIPTFETIETDKLQVITNIQNSKVNPPVQALLIDRIAHFLHERLGPYPFEKMVISETDYKTNPVYGLNQLPRFISPFPDGFEYDMEQLKTITRNYIDNTLIMDSRDDYWLQDALQIYLMMEYVDTYYPKMKIIGNLSNWWIIRWAHAADLEFNDQYPILYLNMARNNIHQALTTPKDSLLKFNMNIANGYYGASGLRYLNDYLGDGVVNRSIKEFYSENRLKPIKSSSFETVLSRNTELPINWFFEDFADTRTTIDFKIKKVEKQGDSLKVFIKNNRNSELPVSLYGLNKEEVVYKTWTRPVDSITTVTIPAENIRKLALNYEGKIPEYNRRNNFKAVKGLLNKPLQFRLFQDVEDPNYTQFFFMPIFEYNLYDGISAGLRLYNKTVLPKAVHYSLEPQFGFRSKTLVGSASISYTQTMDQGNLYAMRYGFSGNYYSYDRGLFYKRFTPYITFAFRNDDLRNNEKQYINLRNVNVYRDENPNDPNQEPNYSVFNMQYVYSNPNLINYFRGVADYEISSKFSKLSVDLEYRKLFLSNRQLNLRFFAGVFLFNDTRENEDFFSFALDRPNDYLFDYNYYGRSEDSGLFSQQLIIAEGGFKSQLEPAYANSWMATVNASTNIWRWIYAYADVGLVSNKKRGTNAVFDSGVRVSLVADYFELYFPIYSNLGFEPNLPHYDEKVRFIITLSPKTLLGLFTRRWY